MQHSHEAARLMHVDGGERRVAGKLEQMAQIRCVASRGVRRSGAARGADGTEILRELPGGRAVGRAQLRLLHSA